MDSFFDDVEPTKTFGDYFQESYKKSFDEHHDQGFQLGTEAGNSIGNELGSICAFCDLINDELEVDDKSAGKAKRIRNLTQKISDTIETFPFDNPAGENFQKSLDAIRANFKQISVMSKNSCKYALEMQKFLEKSGTGQGQVLSQMAMKSNNSADDGGGQVLQF